MRRNTSLYLDVLRVAAAFVVVLGHAHTLAMPAIPTAIANRSSDAVAVFFVLSGLVIRYVTQDRGERDWSSYAAARVARILPVAVAALCVTLVADRIGLALRPETYVLSDRYNAQTGLVTALRAITFTNETWFTHSIFGSNEPFWSLGFEVQYYIAFALMIFLPKTYRVLGLSIWAIIVGPKIIMFAPLWLLGAGTYQLIRNPEKRQPAFGIMAIAMGVALYGALRAVHLPFVPMYNPGSAMRLGTAAAYYTVIGTVACLSIIGVDILAADALAIGSLPEKIIRWLAGGSFSLYLFHLPVMKVIESAWPTTKGSWVHGASATAMTIAICYLLSFVVERPKAQYKMLAKRAFGVPPLASDAPR